MSKHHRKVRDRVAAVIVADLPHTSVPGLLQRARHAQPPTLDSADHGAD